MKFQKAQISKIEQNRLIKERTQFGISLSDEEIELIKDVRNKKSRNQDYILHDFDSNLKKVIETGFDMMDRTNTGCKYLPGINSVIDISKRVPVPTKRQTNWKSMLKQYLWFLSGSDKINDLNAMGSKVWDFWKDQAWAKQKGFSDDSIGYGYGPNLINYGAELGQKGFNQIDYVLNELKINPMSRRILFSFWRPDKISQTKLPPCHMIYQFIVQPDEKGEYKNLSCVMYQRSSDSFVGNLSTNLQGATFLTYMIAQQVDMKPSKLYHNSGHFHVYNNHIDLVKEYLDRGTPNSPILKLNKKNSIYQYTADDFQLEDYNPLAKMNVPIAI